MQITIYVPDELGKRIRAARLSRTVSGICRDALERALDEAAAKKTAEAKSKKGGRHAAR